MKFHDHDHDDDHALLMMLAVVCGVHCKLYTLAHISSAAPHHSRASVECKLAEFARCGIDAPSFLSNKHTHRHPAAHTRVVQEMFIQSVRAEEADFSILNLCMSSSSSVSAGDGASASKVLNVVSDMLLGACLGAEFWQIVFWYCG